MSRSTRSRRTRVFGLAAATVALAGGAVLACESTEPDPSGAFFGPSTSVGDGSGRAYVILDRAGAPTELGLAFTAGALTGLPAGTTEYLFPLPEEAAETPYEHAVLNWQPTGHPMPAVYAVPHFDAHFYTITNAERDTLTAAAVSDLAARMARLPQASFVPAGYTGDGMAVARMGKHWRDPSSPELNGQPFTATMIFGSYDGAFIFTEPMVTTAYLATKPAPVVTPLRLPAQYAIPGYHPTSYTVGWDAEAGEFRIAMSGLVRR